MSVSEKNFEVICRFPNSWCALSATPARICANWLSDIEGSFKSQKVQKFKDYCGVPAVQLVQPLHSVQLFRTFDRATRAGSWRMPKAVQRLGVRACRVSRQISTRLVKVFAGHGIMMICQKQM